MNWLQRIIELVGQEGAAARVVIVETQGPTPRAEGASMLVWASGQSGKIGRREIEARALEAARRMIGSVAQSPTEGQPRWRRETMRFATGNVLGEPAGGSVLVLIEAFGPAEAAALSRLPEDKSATQVLARPMVSGKAPAILDTEATATAPTTWRDGLALLLASPRRMLLRLEHTGADDCLIERIAPQLPRFHVYGTGLVARALVKVLAELPFMATENILMAGVQAGGSRQHLHEVIREHSMEAGRRVKELGLDNDLLERLKLDPAFAKVAPHIDSMVDPAQFVGRAPQQVEEFIAEEVDPLLEQWKHLLDKKASGIDK